MSFRVIDLETWPRRRHFDFFAAMDMPHFTLTAPVDVTAFVPEVKARKVSLTVAVAHVLSAVACQMAEFRQRIRETQVVEHDVVHPSFTVLSQDGLFGFCTVPFHPRFEVFSAQAQEKIDEAKARPSLEDGPGQDDLLFMTAIPWVGFTAIGHPMHQARTDSVPRLAWGKMEPSGNRLQMPLSLQAHHGLMDGLHAGRFFQAVQARFDDPARHLDGDALAWPFPFSSH